LGQDLRAEMLQMNFWDSQTEVNLAVKKGNFKGGNGSASSQKAVKKRAMDKLGEVGQKRGHGFEGQFVALGKTDFKDRKFRVIGHVFALQRIFAVLTTFGLSASRHAFAALRKIVASVKRDTYRRVYR